MKAITVRQPWASLITDVGVKTIETRPRPTAYRGRIAIHAAKGESVRNGGHVGDWIVCRGDGASAPGPRPARMFPVGASSLPRCRRSGEVVLPLGAVVGSAVLTDCVPIRHIMQALAAGENDYPMIQVNGPDIATLVPKDGESLMCDNEIPYGDFTPGRWALLLDDIKPTTERCPACWGEGSEIDGAGGFLWRCDVCDTAGRCDPIPARGQQAVPWEWTP